MPKQEVENEQQGEKHPQTETVGLRNGKRLKRERPQRPQSDADRPRSGEQLVQKTYLAKHEFRAFKISGRNEK